MFNFLKFKENGGREAYEKYLSVTQPLLAPLGAKQILYSTKLKNVIDGNGIWPSWDGLVIFGYPSPQAFK